jgi:hypothetical protein
LDKSEGTKGHPLYWEGQKEGQTGYPGTAVKFVDETLGLVLHISIKIKDGWAVLPKPWVVEHSFAWLGRFRRQSQGFRDPDWDCREYDPYRHAQENACKLRLNFCQTDSKDQFIHLFDLPLPAHDLQPQ